MEDYSFINFSGKRSEIKLISVVQKFPEEKLEKIVGGERNIPLGTGFSFEGLILGLVQHNAYHLGQISLLKKSS